MNINNDIHKFTAISTAQSMELLDAYIESEKPNIERIAKYATDRELVASLIANRMRDAWLSGIARGQQVQNLIEKEATRIVRNMDADDRS